MNLKTFGKVFTSKFVGTGPSSYKNRIYRAAVSQRLRNTGTGHYAELGLVYTDVSAQPIGPIFMGLICTRTEASNYKK
jgi:hypothetical protein